MSLALWAGVAAGGVLAGAVGTALLGLVFYRALVGHLFASWMRRLLTDPYEENLLEFFSSTRKVGLQTTLETSLRAEGGAPLVRPFGTNRRLPGFDGLLFNFAQLAEFPIGDEQTVDLRTVLGPGARRPLVLDLPLLIAPMAYGFSLSGPVKVALAKAATLAGTATSTGEGPFLPEERAAAGKLILQYSRGSWAKDPAILRQVDAVEIQLGAGSTGGVGHTVPAARLDPALRRAMGLAPGQDAVVQALLPGVATADDLAALVATVREAAGGVPVGFKLAAGRDLERDLELAAGAGADFVNVSGAQGGTWGSIATLEDDFGLPTLYALVRAARFLAGAGLRDRVNLIVGGGLATPGDFLKALALGADAVILGTVAIFALAHTQILKALPWEPPTQVIGYHGKLKQKFDVEQGTRNLARFLFSCRAEMVEGLRALGKTSVHQLAPGDLVALDPLTAEICGVGTAYEPPPARPAGPAADKQPEAGTATPAPRAEEEAVKRQPPWLRPPRRPKPLGGD